MKNLAWDVHAHADYAEHVARDGYAIVDDVISAAEVQALRDAVASLEDGEKVRKKRSVYGVRNLLEICPVGQSLAASQAIRRLATPVLGDKCFAVRAIFFDKTPDANWRLGWHQDSVISVRERVDLPEAAFSGSIRRHRRAS